MRQDEMARWLKVMDVTALICCAVLFVVVIPPALAQAADAMGMSALLVPCLAIIWASIIPMAVIFHLGWRIFTDIGHGDSFTACNAHRLKTMSFLAAFVLIIYLVGLIVLSLVGFLPTVLLIVLFLVMIGSLLMAVACAALSHLTAKAAEIQSENDLTV